MFARSIAGYRAGLGDAAAEVLRLVSRDLERAVVVNKIIELPKQPALQRPEIGVILDPDRQIFAELAREARGRHELRPAILSKPEVDDRVDDELVIALAPSDDRPDLHVPAGSISFKVLKDLPSWMVASATVQRIERAPTALELFAHGSHDAPGTFEIGNPALKTLSTPS